MKKILYILISLLLSLGSYARQEYYDLRTHKLYYYTSDQKHIVDHPLVFAGDIFINYLQLIPSQDFKNVNQINKVLYYYGMEYSKTDTLKTKLRNYVKKLYSNGFTGEFNESGYEPTLKEVDSKLKYIYGQLLCFEVDFTVHVPTEENENDAGIVYAEYFYLSLADAQIYTFNDLFPSQQWTALSKRITVQLKDTLRVIFKEDIQKANLAKQATLLNDDSENGYEEDYNDEYDEETQVRMSVGNTIDELHLTKEDLVLYLFDDQCYIAYDIPQHLSSFRIWGTLYLPMNMSTLSIYIPAKSPLKALLERRTFTTQLKNVNVFNEINYDVQYQSYDYAAVLDFSPYMPSPYPRLKTVEVIDSNQNIRIQSYSYNQKGQMTAFDYEAKGYKLTYNSQNKVSSIVINTEDHLYTLTFKYDRQQNLVSYIFKSREEKKIHNFKYIGNHVYETIYSVSQQDDTRNFGTGFDQYTVNNFGKITYQKSNAIHRTYNARQQMLSETNDYVRFNCYSVNTKILSSEVVTSYGVDYSGYYYHYDTLQRITEMLYYKDNALHKRLEVKYPDGKSNLIQSVMEKGYNNNEDRKGMHYKLKYSFW